MDEKKRVFVREYQVKVHGQGTHSTYPLFWLHAGDRSSLRDLLQRGALRN